MSRNADTLELLRKLINSFDIAESVSDAVPGTESLISPNYNARRASLERTQSFKRKELPKLDASRRGLIASDATLSTRTTPLSSDDEEHVGHVVGAGSRERGTAAESNYFEAYSANFIDFTYENPTIYHVVKFVSDILESYGFQYLSEKTSWGADLQPGLYYTTRNHTALSTFVIGDGWTPEDGVGLVGAHIDALTAKLKPCSKKSKVDGFELLGVAPYAGALSEVWWDRDLHIGGNVLVRDSATGKVVSRLVKSDFPIARMPSLAPHFGKNFADYLNKETRAVPVIAYDSGEEEAGAGVSASEAASPLVAAHSITLLRFIAGLAGVEVKDLVQLDLDIYDGQKGTVGGIKKDFLYAPRIDDRICGFAAVFGLLEFLEARDFKVPSRAFSVVTLYDNEEIGSLSRQGAQGGLSESVVERVVDSYVRNKGGLSVESLCKVAYANTLILSADVTHALNPNFGDFYLEHHKPQLNTGMTIAYDERAMATDVAGRAIIEQVARLNGDTLQRFHIRNDSRSGGTIGPYISSKTGARTIDLGIAQWSMHSIRAAVGSRDVGLGVKFFAGFFKYWRQVADDFGDL